MWSPLRLSCEPQRRQPNSLRQTICTTPFLISTGLLGADVALQLGVSMRVRVSEHGHGPESVTKLR